jgi:hypothetical protein
MSRINCTLAAIVTVVTFVYPAVVRGKNGAAIPVETTRAAAGRLWQEPADIASRDLYYGPGGRDHQPRGPFTFLKEDRNGSNPKFTIVDTAGTRWKVKLGVEARPETAATRLVWAIGYGADEDYFVQKLCVEDLPAHLHRGNEQVEAGGVVRNVRLERESEGQKKIGDWSWRHNPFEHSREFNGLRVLMAVINDWDLKDKNTAIRGTKDSHGNVVDIYYISDLGATFGTNAIARPRAVSKGDLDSYRDSGFIKKIAPEYVDFATPKRPPIVFLVNPHEFFSRLCLDWIGHHVPRADARWTGELLSRLSDGQLRDAFRAAGFPAADIDGFTAVLKDRIVQLRRL